jgi:transposase InsO family protein
MVYGWKKLNKAEARAEKRIIAKQKKLNRYEKAYPGEMIHLDTKRLPLLLGEAVSQPREYLFVAIDDHSRNAFADIFPDKTAYSAAIFLEEARRFFAFPVRGIYSDNGSEYKGKIGHPIHDLCLKYQIHQSFTKVKHPWTNGIARPDPTIFPELTEEDTFTLILIGTTK